LIPDADNDYIDMYWAYIWSGFGARIVSVSPGAISTLMVRLELQIQHVADLVKMTPMQRMARPKILPASCHGLGTQRPITSWVLISVSTAA